MSSSEQIIKQEKPIGTKSINSTCPAIEARSQQNNNAHMALQLWQ